MSEQGKHTPGPWTWFTGFNWNTAETIREPGDRVRYVMGGPNDQGLAHTVGLDEETDTANARLIAAAPELYAALKETAHALGMLVLASGDFCALNARAIDAANTAIAKAEGRA